MHAAILIERFSPPLDAVLYAQNAKTQTQITPEIKNNHAASEVPWPIRPKKNPNKITMIFMAMIVFNCEEVEPFI